MSPVENKLIPEASKWMDANLNAMLIGLHGVGKTQVVLDLCEEKGLKLKYYSCSTLDPFTDLVGVPFARTDSSGTEHLKMVRPRELDEAEILFFDEFNRADPKVHNALMEIIQFRTLNGEPLPNLRMVWAAMNPPGADYDVEELDPALIDRFDVFEDVAAKPSAEYLSNQGIALPIAQALVAWHSQQGKKRDAQSMVTPRRLEKIGRVWTLTGSFKHSLPNWFDCDREKLRSMLNEAQNRVEVAEEISEEGGSAHTGPLRRFDYNDTYAAKNEVDISDYLRANPEDIETHKMWLKTLENRQSGRVVNEFGPIFDAMLPSLVESYLSGLKDGKLRHIRRKMDEVSPTLAPRISRFQKAVEAEAARRNL